MQNYLGREDLEESVASQDIADYTPDISCMAFLLSDGSFHPGLLV